MVRLSEQAGVENVRSQPDLLGDFLADGDLIARDHLHADAHFLGGIDGGLRVFSRRVGKREHAEELPAVLLVGARDAQRAKAARGKLVDRFFDLGPNLVGVGRQRQDDLGRALGDLELPAIRQL